LYEQVVFVFPTETQHCYVVHVSARATVLVGGHRGIITVVCYPPYKLNRLRGKKHSKSITEVQANTG
jgi:hypothetical protein